MCFRLCFCMSYFLEKAWPQYGQLNRFPSPLGAAAVVPALAVAVAEAEPFLPALSLVDASTDLPLLPIDGVGISCCCCLPRAATAAELLSALEGRPTFLGLATVAPGVATTRALAGVAPLAGLALLPLVVLAIAAAAGDSKK